MQKERVFHDNLALGLPSKDEDVLTAKRLFKEVGRLEEPPGGFSPQFDRDLDDVVTGLQRDNGLKVDGLITPGGPTERNIHRDRGELPREPPFDLSELNITAAIGNGLTNKPEEIIGISKALGRLDLFNFDKTAEPSPIISHKLVAGLQKLQRKHGIPDTGEMKPGDRTEAVLKAEATKAMGDRAAKGRQDAIDQKFADPDTFTDGPHKDPHISQFGGTVLTDLTTDQLKERFIAATGGLENQAKILNDLNRKSMSAQDKEDPIRQNLDELGRNLHRKFGTAIATSLLNFIVAGTLSRSAAVGFVKIVPDVFEFESRMDDLTIAHGKTMKAREPEDLQRDKVLIWLTEQRNIDAILKDRASEEHR